MDREAIDRLLTQTLEDIHFSRAERHEVRRQLEDFARGPHDLNMVRNRGFALASERVSSEKDRLLLEWLRELVRVVDSQRPRTQEGVSCQALFSPGTACLERLVAMIHGTRRSLDACVYTITDDRITRPLLEAHDRGVKVRVITEDSKALDVGSDISRIEAAGVPVEDDDAPSLMHHKFAIFDGVSLATGSYNWTRSAASSNQENLIVTSHPPLVRDFAAEFERLWEAFRR